MLRSTRGAWRLLSLLLAFGAMTACSETREVGNDLLADVEAGSSRDSLMQLIGTGPLTAHYSDTLRVRQGYRYSKYYVNGQSLEVLYYREAPGDVSEPVKQARETPIVLRDQQVLGWGWRFYVEEGMAKLGLPTPLREEVARPAPAAPPAQNPGRTPPAQGNLPRQRTG